MNPQSPIPNPQSPIRNPKSTIRGLRLQFLGFSFSFSDFSFSAYNRALRLTREGGAFILMVFALGITALNTGINLIYLLFSMCLSFIIVSGILSEYTLRGVRCRRRVPEEVHPGDYFPVTLIVANEKKRWPTFSLWVEQGLEGTPEVQKFYFLRIPPGGQVEKTGMWRLEKRGRTRFPEMILSTRFPFGFFIKSTRVGGGDEVIVYPRVAPLEIPSEGSSGEGATPWTQKGKGDDLYGLRKFVTGDDYKRVHWKATAKLQELMLKETEAALEPKVIVVFDNILPPGREQDPAALDRFEADVERAASAVQRLAENGHEIELVTNDGAWESTGAPDSLRRIFRLLALIEPARATRPEVAYLKQRADAGGVFVV